MNLNYTAFALISFVPLVLAAIWYHPRSVMVSWSGLEVERSVWDLGVWKIGWLLLLSVAIVYGYINLVIHQMGFYELFFTDIMMGNVESKRIVKEFLGKYGQKHRHFGHGVFHGAINAFVFALPFVGIHAVIESRSRRYLAVHFGFWLVTGSLMGGLIAAFV